MMDTRRLIDPAPVVAAMSNTRPLANNFVSPAGPMNDIEPPAADARPLCVDLDGTLILTDSLFEGVAGAFRDGHTAALLSALLTGNRAAFKERTAGLAQIDVSLFPYNEELLGFLRRQREQGRRIVLATAADRRIADAVAAHLGIFDEVLASDGTTNLKGAAKAAALVERFGEKGFVYAGNDVNDVPVMRAVGFSISPRDGHESAKSAARMILQSDGGRGAVRELCDLLLTRLGRD